MLIYGFNEPCNNISASYLKVGDESMSAIRFWTTAKGDLPHLSYILHKTEPLGTEFKNVACSVTGALFFVEIQRGKEGVNNRNYHLQIGATSACTKKMTESTKWLGQSDVKGATKDYFMFDIWFSSNKSEKADMNVGSDMIGTVKTNTK